MKHTLKVSIIFICCILFGCDVTKQLGGAYAMTQCKYEYHSISGLHLAGIDLSHGVSLLQIPQAVAVLTGKLSSVPLNFTLNINVNNPNSSVAMLHGLQYILSVDDINFTSGTVEHALQIPSGGSQQLPLTISVDLAMLLKGESGDTALNIAKNFLGIGDHPSNVTFHIKPAFIIGNVPVTSPSYIPVNFTVGNRKFQ